MTNDGSALRDLVIVVLPPTTTQQVIQKAMQANIGTPLAKRSGEEILKRGYVRSLTA